MSELKCSSDPLVIAQKDDHAAKKLVVLSDLLQDAAQVPLDLSNDG